MVVQYTENTQLSTSESVAGKMTETPDENVDTEEKNLLMTWLFLVIIVIVVFWRNKDPKMINFGSKQKKRYGEWEDC